MTPEGNKSVGKDEKKILPIIRRTCYLMLYFVSAFEISFPTGRIYSVIDLLQIIFPNSIGSLRLKLNGINP